MFAVKNTKNSKEALRTSKKTEMLEEIIDSQNKELIRLRYLARKSEDLDKQKEELEKLTETYESLCCEVRNCKIRYDELNKQLTETMRRYKKDMGRRFL